MPRLVIARRSGRRNSTIGDIPILSDLVGNVEASARAELYQQLANFQGIPQRINRVIGQLNAYALAAPGRSLDDSAKLSAIQAGTSALQAQWQSTNGNVSSAIAAIAGGAGLNAAGSVAEALAGITVVTQGADLLEQQARALVSSSSGLADSDRASILAMGAGYSLDLVTIGKYAIGAFVGYKFLQWLGDRRRRGG